MAAAVATAEAARLSQEFWPAMGREALFSSLEKVLPAWVLGTGSIAGTWLRGRRLCQASIFGSHKSTSLEPNRVQSL